ncbi:FAD-binding oxidoreductase [Amycolatopsis sp. EV170708-02-1]|uniref:FAD-binding oxidoreductase n=1 Tax=Amycolatopsis sp. EV170708-02-1 TaxID=2919322 RepID=UPI001F0C4610|nr:FAD-binding oxidoreductase [Amycolatopsis sp. EV170708-02-1]UMP07012.1 FAD-binding oxidoreductase [Amycolatopsis sp. EV170708-02-1]
MGEPAHRAEPDLGEHRPRTVRTTHFPTTTESVRQIVLAARSQKTPLYPLSTGRNWGMGSRSPVVDDCTVLDLSGMNIVRTLNLDEGYAVIEPGVTQRQLSELLAGTPWMLNVTAGCADASIVGNTLERGDGTIRARSEDLLGVEVVLGTGEIMTTGGLDRHGLRSGAIAGPDLTRAFVQSNLGIVTAMAISLIPRPDAIKLIHATFADKALGPVLEAMIRVGRSRIPTNGLLRLKEIFVVPEGGSPAVPESADPGSVTVQVPLLGSQPDVENAERDIRTVFHAVTELKTFRAIDSASTPETDDLYDRARFAHGIPSCAPLRAGMRVDDCAQVDASPVGWLMFLPTVPLRRASLLEAIDLMRIESEAHRTAAMLEFNVISQHSTNMVTQIPFVREPASIERAHALRRAARKSFLRAGFPPYRSNIDQEPLELADRSVDFQDGPLSELKRLCDPDGIIAPGRYVVAER